MSCNFALLRNWIFGRRGFRGGRLQGLLMCNFKKWIGTEHGNSRPNLGRMDSLLCSLRCRLSSSSHSGTAERCRRKSWTRFDRGTTLEDLVLLLRQIVYFIHLSDPFEPYQGILCLLYSLSFEWKATLGQCKLDWDQCLLEQILA